MPMEVQRELECLNTNNNSIEYLKEQRTQDIKICIKQELFLKWKVIAAENREISFLKLLMAMENAFPFELKPGNKRIEERLRDCTSKAYGECKGVRGNKRVKLLEKRRVITIYPEEILNASSLKRRSQELEIRNEELQKENAKLNKAIEERDKQCSDLLEELIELRAKQHPVSNCVLENENKELQNYIKDLESRFEKESLKMKGKKSISEVGARQRQRKIKELTEKAEKTLWFVESFGLKLDSLSLRDSAANKVKVSLGDKKTVNKSTFSSLPEEDKDKLRATLLILDKFCIGDSAYHELTMRDGEHEKSYLVKQCRTDLNRLIHVTRTPGEDPGVQMSFREELSYQLSKKMEKGEVTQADIRISGDGAKMSRISSFVVMSFSLLCDEEAVMSAFGNHVFAIISTKENYDHLKEPCSEIFEEISGLAAQKKITVNDKEVPLEFYLSGDYKFLLLVTGLNAANSRYACIYCKIKKEDRWDMSKPEEHFWSENIKRTLTEIKELSNKSNNNYGCIHQPLLNIPLENIRIDELHLLLRITDVLERNLIDSCIEWDNRDGISGACNDVHLKNLVKAFCQCGVSFSCWRKKNETQKETGVYEWTSMTGGDKKKVLSQLPHLMDEALLGPNAHKIKQIWLDFKDLYDTISTWDPTPEIKAMFFNKAKEWTNQYLSLGDIESGYGRKTITPYMHMLVYHVPKFLKHPFALKRFTGQGIEKINDLVRSIYHQKCNRHDACTEAMLALKRIDRLQEHERNPNKYTKKNDDYWNNTIFEQRRKRKRISIEPREKENLPQNSNNDVDVLNLTAVEIKQKLIELGVTTRIRNLNKLRRLLQDHLNG